MEKEVYQENNKRVQFKLELAWEVVCNAPKWAQEGSNSKQDLIVKSLESSRHSTTSESQIEKQLLSSDNDYQSPFENQPIGCAKSKCMCLENSNSESFQKMEDHVLEISEKKIKAMQNSSRAEQELFEIERHCSCQDDLEVLKQREEDLADD
ncbi:hypothetical protein O181_094049 [Austropuccinia psidii MF-1]|uniref:No apical meristem-associated C-terminal domain-containing protein n=1 Tax=Austropuccinia psidii MF-1 TaxID=1389203 RepID=A0A9Q3J2N3_9BASI|nr:hypothetical protein [Austropuccinia psidii MF-1]